MAYACRTVDEYAINQKMLLSTLVYKAIGPDMNPNNPIGVNEKISPPNEICDSLSISSEINLLFFRHAGVIAMHCVCAKKIHINK